MVCVEQQRGGHRVAEVGGILAHATAHGERRGLMGHELAARDQLSDEALLLDV